MVQKSSGNLTKDYQKKLKWLSTYLVLAVLCLVQQQAFSQNINWIDFAESSSNSTINVISTESDSEGNVVVMGTVKGTVTSDEVDYVSGVNESDVSVNNLFLTKYDADGDVLWSYVDARNRTAVPFDMTIDNENNINLFIRLVSDDSEAPFTVTFEDSTFTADSTNFNSEANFGILAKFGNDGSFISASQIGGVPLNAALKSSLTGELLVGLNLNDPITLDENTGEDFLLKLTSEGELVWGQTGGFGTINDLDLDSEGNIYTTGFKVLSKFDSMGNLLDELTQTGTFSNSEILIKDENIFLASRYSGTIAIGDTTVGSVGNYDVFVTKYDTTLTRSWIKRGGSLADDGVTGLTLGADHLYVAGYYTGGFRFPVENMFGLSYTGRDGFVMKLNTDDGELDWTQRISSTSTTTLKGLVLTPDERIFISGNYLAEFKIEGETKSSVTNLESGFVAELLEPTLSFKKLPTDEVYAVGEDVDLSYLGAGANSIKIEFSINNGTTWLNIHNATVDTNPNIYQKEVSWSVPNIESDSVKVRIYDLSSSQLYQESELFAIKQLPIASSEIDLKSITTSRITQQVIDSVFVQNIGYGKLSIDSLSLYRGVEFSVGMNTVSDSLMTNAQKYIKFGITGDDFSTFKDTLFVHHNAKYSPLKIALEGEVTVPTSIAARFRHLGTFTQLPSYVNVLFQVTDPETNDGLTYLDKSGKAGLFELREEGTLINPDAPETNFRVGKFDEVDYSLQTVMVLDNSRSLGQQGLNDLKNAALTFIDQLIEGQEIAIYVFAGDITLVQDFSTDVDELKSAINAIQLSETTNTNLYGATMEALDKIEENFLPEVIDSTGTLGGIKQAFLMVFTDGADNAATFTLDEVITERSIEDKQIFTVAFGDSTEINPLALINLGNAGYFAVQNSSQLNESFTQVQNRIRNLANSFYWLNYISPKRADGVNSITIEVKNNIYYDILTSSFSSSGFSDVTPGITINPTLNRISGIDTLKVFGSDPYNIVVETLFGTIDSEYNWTAGSENFISLVVDSNDPTKAVIEKISDAGLETSFTVTDVPNYELEPNLPFRKKIVVILDNETELTTSIVRDFGGASSPQDYRLIGIPGNVNVPISDVMENTQWEAYHDNGNDEDYLEKYDGSEDFNFKPGNGFWVTGTSGLQYDEKLEFAELNEDNQIAIPLHTGWNIISNPLTVDVPWDTVSTLNGGELQPIWRFEGEFAVTDTMYSSINGEAFYFLNDKDLEELLIPFVPKSNGKLNSTNPTNQISFFAFVNNKRTSQSSIQFIDERSAVTRDVVAPVTGFEGASLLFTKENDRKGKREAYYSSVTERVFTDQLFNLVLLSSGKQKVKLNVSGDLNQFERALLINKETGDMYDLHVQDSPEFFPSSTTTPFVLIMGSDDFVRSEQSQYLPKQIEISQNYPNPFNPTTTLRFSMPEQAQVRLQIFDVIGRRVAVLVNETRQAGVYNVNFDASRFASGMYFAVFEIGNHRFTQKMMLIK